MTAQTKPKRQTVNWRKRHKKNILPTDNIANVPQAKKKKRNKDKEHKKQIKQRI